MKDQWIGAITEAGVIGLDFPAMEDYLAEFPSREGDKGAGEGGGGDSMTRDEFATVCRSLHEAWSVLYSDGGAIGLMSHDSRASLGAPSLGAPLEVQVQWSDLVGLLAEPPVQLSFRNDREYPWEAAAIVGKVRVYALLTTAQKEAAEQDGLAVAGLDGSEWELVSFSEVPGDFGEEEAAEYVDSEY